MTKKVKALTQKQAQVLVDAYNIHLNVDDEETDLLRESNPELYDAYKGLLALAVKRPAAKRAAPTKRKDVGIKPVDEAGDCSTGNLAGLTKDDIVRILGFKPNIKDDPSKVKYSWGFTVDGVRCGVWDYKGSYRSKYWSTFGPRSALIKVFGKNVQGF